MKTTADYMDDLRAHLDVDSDFKAMNAVGVNHRQQVSRYRKMHGTFDEPLSLKIAETLGIDGAEILLAMQIQRESNESVRKVWARIADRMAVAAALAVLAFLPFADLDTIGGGVTLAGMVNGVESVYYVKYPELQTVAHYWPIFALLFAAFLWSTLRHTPPKD